MSKDAECENIGKGCTNEVWSSLLPDSIITSAAEVLVAKARL
jgi:hypothetical protein